MNGTASTIPPTGDESTLGLWLMLLALSACGMMTAMKMRRE
jgi:hypothetical protein